MAGPASERESEWVTATAKQSPSEMVSVSANPHHQPRTEPRTRPVRRRPRWPGPQMPTSPPSPDGPTAKIQDEQVNSS